MDKEQARRFLSSRIEAKERRIKELPKNLEGIVDDEIIQKSIESCKRELGMFYYLRDLNEDS
jgi:hypothetical protein